MRSCVDLVAIAVSGREKEEEEMPYQSSFTLIIIAGAFTATGGVLALGNWLETGKLKRPIGQDLWTHVLASRDNRLKAKK